MIKEEIINFLKGHDDHMLFKQSRHVKCVNVGDNVYLRGLIEVTNICKKDCLYCGIRSSNKNVDHYQLSFDDVKKSIQYSIDQRFGSIVIQGGERTDENFILFIEQIVKYAKFVSNGKLGITLSLGQQDQNVYHLWRSAGAHRYLLRIESSSPQLYTQIHPKGYSWSERLCAIKRLQTAGFQTGSGVMIGLPFQTIETLAEDLLFLKNLDIDMCGMGPYIEHQDTPLSQFRSKFNRDERVILTLRMIALLRILMPKINIASTTALQTLDNKGFKKGIDVGANIIMPNITPSYGRVNYNLYENKPLSTIDLSQFKIAYQEWGDSIHFSSKQV